MLHQAAHEKDFCLSLIHRIKFFSLARSKSEDSFRRTPPAKMTTWSDALAGMCVVQNDRVNPTLMNFFERVS